MRADFEPDLVELRLLDGVGPMPQRAPPAAATDSPRAMQARKEWLEMKRQAHRQAETEMFHARRDTAPQAPRPCEVRRRGVGASNRLARYRGRGRTKSQIMFETPARLSKLGEDRPWATAPEEAR